MKVAPELTPEVAPKFIPEEGRPGNVSQSCLKKNGRLVKKYKPLVKK
jgi:hypothetical protein